MKVEQLMTVVELIESWTVIKRCGVNEIWIVN